MLIHHSVDVDSLKAYLALSRADKIFFCSTEVTNSVLEELSVKIREGKQGLRSLLLELHMEKELLRVNFELVDHVPAAMAFFNTGR